MPLRISGKIEALILALMAVACARTNQPASRNVLIVSFDTLRADRLGVYGNEDWEASPSPWVDMLASEGTLFEQAYAPRGQTHPSMAAMLTGKYPITTGLRENGQRLAADHRTIFQRLADEGFRTGVFVSNFKIEGQNDPWVARGVEVALGGASAKFDRKAQRNVGQALWDDLVEEAALDFLANTDVTRPFAAWVHFYDVHKPYNPPVGYENLYGVGDGIPPFLLSPELPGRWLDRYLDNTTLEARDLEPAVLRRIRGLYDETVTATDDRLGRILGALRDGGLLDSTYVLFTSDHGDELYDHNRYFFHAASIYDGVVRLPLVVRGPDISRGRRVDAHVQNIDIAPTLLDLLDLPADPTMEGHSLVPLLRGETDEPPAPYAFVEWQDLIYAVTDGRFKLIWNPEHVHPRKSPYALERAPPGLGFRIDCLEAYNLQSDPREQVNLLADFDYAGLQDGRGLPDPLQPLFASLRSWLADPRHRRRMNAANLEATEIKSLRALGYIPTGVGEDGARTDSVRKAPCLQP